MQWSHNYNSKRRAEKVRKLLLEMNLEASEVEEYDDVRGLPDYLNSLDAMHEAEKVLTRTQEFEYHDWLVKLSPDNNRHRCYEACRSPAGRRAEAFLRTLNLWEP